MGQANSIAAKPMAKPKKIDGLYKRRYLIAFYDSAGEEYQYGFNTVQEICRFKGMEITSNNINQLNVELYRALRRKEPITRMLTGKAMQVYLIDMSSDDN